MAALYARGRRRYKSAIQSAPMRAAGPLVLLNAALVLGLCAGRGGAGAVAPSHAIALPPLVAAPMPAPVAESPATLVPAPLAVAVAETAVARELPRHEELAARAEAGDAEAALDLANMLESCADRDETRAIMHVIVTDDGGAPACGDADTCASVDRLYDEFDRSLEGWRDAERECAAVPHDWLDARGKWLRRAAELGDPEAMACYAVAGVELAPSSFHAEFAPYMEHWRSHAAAYAWQAWDRGEPRAALALARLYGPASGLRTDAAIAVEPDPRLSFRFALFVTRALDLDPEVSDLAAQVEATASSMSPTAYVEEDEWAQARLPAFRARLALPSRMPEGCWQHFAMFERTDVAATAMR